MNGKSSPEIRFKGYTHAWGHRRLGEISTKVSEKNKSGEYDETLTNSAELGIISQRDFFDKDISNANNLDGYYVVRPDDFVYNPRISNLAPVGPIKRNLLGRTGVMSPLYYVFRLAEADCTYIEKYFETDYWHKFMRMNGDSGARADRFNIKDALFEDMPIPLPTLPEQAAIGKFFRALDDIIAGRERKLSGLRKLKKGYLQQMFPQPGERVPRVRFAGFEGEWVERRLGDVVETSFGGGTPATSNDEFWNGDIPWLQSSDLTEHKIMTVNLRKRITPKGLEGSAAKLVPANSVAIVTRVGVGKLSVVPFQYTTSQDFLSLSNFNIDIWFGAYSTYKKIQSELTSVQGTSIKGITKDDLLNKTIDVPIIREEQTAIGNFFLSIDEQIAAESDKLKQLKRLKAAYLQKMFV